MEAARPERSLSELVADLSRQTGELIRQEMRLAKAELSGKVAELSRGATMLGAGVVLALTAIMAMAAAIVLLIIEAGIDPWIAAAITAAIFALLGFSLVQAGLAAFKRQSLAPTHTIDSLKETTQWLKNETR
jgi:uncharacterized membrane protein YqjE